MTGDAVAVVALRLGPDRERVLARIGGELGRQARAKADAIAKLDASAQKLERARVMATSRMIWPAGLRAIHPTWIEAALAELPAAARTAVANGQGDPQVTGGDLDTLGRRDPSLSPDEIQPGDPEIKIPAPIDAKSVVVAFPFGEIKRAVWDADVEAWMVRFLIDKDTPDGQYFARITVTHADGRIEMMSLPYVVDTKAPIVELTAKRVTGGYKITAKQIAANGNGRKDADKVEVQLPDGSILTLTETKWGRFEGVWLTSVLTESVTLRVVARDRAMNQAIQSLTIGAGK